jgi:hypothetical protein
MNLSLMEENIVLGGFKELGLVMEKDGVCSLKGRL